jgi:proteasome lid subunit RPN8/RPN11
MSSNNQGGQPDRNSDKDQEASANEWESKTKVVRKCFQGPDTAQALFRIALSSKAYADIAVHAKESLDAEICGVLIGQVCKDDNGLFISVTDIIRGESAKRSKTHVTFTQDTWNRIHAQKDKNFSDLQIVGWYHSHPGFGVEVSDMDRFIHKNFFPASTQVAFVTDPLGGNVAILVNTDEGLQYVERFWVDGKEHKCYVPAEQSGAASSAAGFADYSRMFDAVESVNTRLSHVLQTVDAMRESLYKFLLVIGFVFCTGIIIGIGYHIYSSVAFRNEPPKVRNFVPVPIQIGDKTIMVGVGIVNWDVPPELNAAYLQAELMKRQAEAEKLMKEKPVVEDTNSTKTNSTLSDKKPVTGEE